MFGLHFGKNIPIFKRQTQMHTLSGFIIFRKKVFFYKERKTEEELYEMQYHIRDYF